LIADVVAIANDGFTAANTASLVGNLAGLALPGATGVGLAARGAVEGAQAATKAASKADTLAANKLQGAAGEAKTAAKLGPDASGRRVTLESSTTGRKSVVDFTTKDKGVVETKTGNAQLSQGQKDVKADIDAGRDVIPRGQNAEKAGLTPNQPTQMKCFDVDRC
jgi:hypothetical protein